LFFLILTYRQMGAVTLTTSTVGMAVPLSSLGLPPKCVSDTFERLRMASCSGVARR
jgi:hypothetical protein